MKWKEENVAITATEEIIGQQIAVETPVEAGSKSEPSLAMIWEFLQRSNTMLEQNSAALQNLEQNGANLQSKLEQNSANVQSKLQNLEQNSVALQNKMAGKQC